MTKMMWWSLLSLQLVMTSLFHLTLQQQQHSPLSSSSSILFASASSIPITHHHHVDNKNGIVSIVSQFPKQHPMIFAVGITCIKSIAADVLVQTIERQQQQCTKSVMKRPLNKTRLFIFGLYGTLYLGIVQYLVFTQLYTRLFPLAQPFAMQSPAAKLKNVAGAIQVLAQVLLDILIHDPIGLIPAFYVIQQAIYSIVSPQHNNKNNNNMSTTTKSRDNNNNLWDTFSQGLVKQLQQNWWSDVSFCIRLWIPASLINFSFMPLHWQVPFTAMVSFIYTFVLSFRRGRNKSNGGVLDDDDNSKQS